MAGNRLKRAHTLLEKGHKGLQKEAADLNQRLLELKQNKLLVEESFSGCAKDPGDKLSPMTCWNINDFSELASQITEMIEQRIKQQQSQLALLHEKIKKKKIMTAGLERLLLKEEKKRTDLQTYIERQELEESLLREKINNK